MERDNVNDSEREFVLVVVQLADRTSEGEPEYDSDGEVEDDSERLILVEVDEVNESERLGVREADIEAVLASVPEGLM